MSSVTGLSHYDPSRHLNFISTAPFGDNIFAYNPNTAVGTLFGTLTSLLQSATVTAVTAPAGRVLRVTNKKIFPGANPCAQIIKSTGTQTLPTTGLAVGLPTTYIGVFDAVTGLSGVIDPNDSLFAIYNVDKAIDSLDGRDSSNVAHRGNSVYTGGNVIAAGGVGVGPVASVLTQTAGNVVADGSITAGQPVVYLTPVTAAAAPTTQAITGLQQIASQVMAITISSAATAASILTCTSFPPSGSVVTLAVTVPPQASAITTTMTFSTGITYVAATMAFVSTAGGVTQYYTVSYTSSGTALVETSRSVVLTVFPTAILAAITGGNFVATAGKVVLSNTFVSAAATPMQAGSAVSGTFTIAGATLMVVFSSAILATSVIIVSRKAALGTSGAYSVASTAAGTFTVQGTASDTSTFNWAVIN